MGSLCDNVFKAPVWENAHSTELELNLETGIFPTLLETARIDDKNYGANELAEGGGRVEMRVEMKSHAIKGNETEKHFWFN